MRHALIVGWLSLAACDVPPMKLEFRLTDGPAQKCIGDTGNETTNCADFTMACRGVLSVRVVPPDDPEVPYISVCKPLLGGQNKLCSIASIDLSPPIVRIPEQTLEVQMAVFEEHQVPTDDNGDFVCPRVQFAANNLPIAAQEPCTETDTSLCPVEPAIGGRAYYYPGDAKTVVELGCTNAELLRGEACSAANTISVAATVNDFDTQVSVSKDTADRLYVAIGEPLMNPLGGYDLTTASALNRAGIDPPTWSANITDAFKTSTCVEVLEDFPQATRTLTCRAAMPGEDVDITGYRLTRLTLSQILSALGDTTFPDQGLVVGVVLNQFFTPVSGATVVPSSPATTIKYLSADRMSIVTGGTSSNGIFISEDAPYGSTFAWAGQGMSVLGGLVEGKVTIVVLQQAAQTM